MKSLQFLKAAAVSMACLGIVCPQAELSAAGPQASATSVKSVKKSLVADVALGKSGKLSGMVVDSQGIALDGAIVSVRQGKQEVAKAITDKQGRFEAPNLKGGVYHIVAGQGGGLYRFWSEKTAPPIAKAEALVVSGNQIVRAQYGGLDVITLTTIGASVTAAVLAGLTLSEVNDLDDKVDRLAETP